MFILGFLDEAFGKQLFDFAACIGNRHSQTAADLAKRYAFALGQILQNLELNGGNALGLYLFEQLVG